MEVREKEGRGRGRERVEDEYMIDSVWSVPITIQESKIESSIS